MIIVFVILVLLVPVIIWITGRSVFLSRVNQFLPLVEKAGQELHDLCTPMHYFTAEEERCFIDKYSWLKDDVEKKILRSIFIIDKKTTPFRAFVNHMNRLGKLRKKNNSDVSRLIQANEGLSCAIRDYDSIFSGESYIAENSRLSFVSRWKALCELIKSLESDGLSMYLESGWRSFLGNYSKTGQDKDRLNKLFIETEQKNRKLYFDNLLKYPLDPQQREAIITVEDNCLVVSSAGSGKTSTIEGRVHYLVDHLHVDPEKILLMTYTNKAADSLTERLNIDGLKCYTFHKLASRIIVEETGVKPSFADDSLKKIAFDELVKDEEFLKAVNDYFTNYFAAADEFDYEKAEDYYDEFQRSDNKAFFPDMRGRSIFTRSGQEKKICYYLSINGVRFLYEEAYEFPTADSFHRQYKPDFTIEYIDAQGIRRRLYYEHFGINKDGKTPKWFGDGKEGGWEQANADYISGIEWKRKTHQEHGTTLMETTSADFDGNNFEEILLQKLRSYGVPINPISPREIYTQIVQSNPSIAKEFSRLLESFLSLMKSGCKTVNDIDPNIISDKKLRRRISFMFERIVKPYCQKYQSLLEERGEIDFTDAIIKATHLCTEKSKTRYEHIIVDEFQDISFDRFHFIQALRSKSPFTYLFCVGDDWQSIYRFAGSDMALFKRFKDFFGFTKACPIETTYRFGEPLISKAANFITKNPIQTEKHVRAYSEDCVSDMMFHEYTDSTLGGVIQDILDVIPENETVLFLGRYGFDITVLNNIPGFRVKNNDERGEVKYKNRTCQFLSVHKAKGLEADHVILLSCNSGFYGFPSNIADDPVLKLVLSEDDQYEYGEERRLFYVAITRSKKMSHILYDESYPSPFVREFIPGLPEEDVCPWCRRGKKLLRMKGIARNGSTYVMYGCSNYKLGCEYVQFVFDNTTQFGEGYYGPF